MKDGVRERQVFISIFSGLYNTAIRELLKHHPTISANVKTTSLMTRADIIITDDRNKAKDSIKENKTVVFYCWSNKELVIQQQDLPTDNHLFHVVWEYEGIAKLTQILCELCGTEQVV